MDEYAKKGFLGPKVYLDEYYKSLSINPQKKEYEEWSPEQWYNDICIPSEVACKNQCSKCRRDIRKFRSGKYKKPFEYKCCPACIWFNYMWKDVDVYERPSFNQKKRKDK